MTFCKSFVPLFFIPEYLCGIPRLSAIAFPPA